MQEAEVLELLSDDLKLELIVSLNSKMLNSQPIFNLYEMTFIYDITFMLKRETFAIDEIVFAVTYHLM